MQRRDEKMLLVRKPERKRPFRPTERPDQGWKDRIHLAQNTVQWWAL